MEETTNPILPNEWRLHNGSVIDGKGEDIAAFVDFMQAVEWSDSESEESDSNEEDRDLHRLCRNIECKADAKAARSFCQHKCSFENTADPLK